MNLPKVIAITNPRKITPARNLIQRKNLLLLTKAEKEKKALKINYKNIWLKPKNERRKVENDDINVCFKKTQCFFMQKLIRICLLINEKSCSATYLLQEFQNYGKSHINVCKFIIGPVQIRSMLEISTYLQSKYLHTESTSSYF